MVVTGCGCVEVVCMCIRGVSGLVNEFWTSGIA